MKLMLKGIWAVPVIFGVLFLSILFSAQDVYGPHYTGFDGTAHHFQGQSQYINVVSVHNGIFTAAQKAGFEVCVTIESIVDPNTASVIDGNLQSSCGPLIAAAPPDENNFVVLEPIIVPWDPNGLTDAQAVDVTASVEIINRGGKAIAGKTTETFLGIVLDYGPTGKTIEIFVHDPEGNALSNIQCSLAFTKNGGTLVTTLSGPSGVDGLVTEEVPEVPEGIDGFNPTQCLGFHNGVFFGGVSCEIIPLNDSVTTFDMTLVADFMGGGCGTPF